jgi:hypothetical protein
MVKNILFVKNVDLHTIKKWAKECQNWCERYNSCNIEIIKHSVQLK